MFKHILLEVYCSYGWDDKDKNVRIPEFCCKGVNKPGFHCLENECSFMTFTYADNEICYAGELGVVEKLEDWIGFGGDMEPDGCKEERKKELLNLWNSLCRKKIKEAYDEYMNLKDKM